MSRVLVLILASVISLSSGAEPQSPEKKDERNISISTTLIHNVTVNVELKVKRDDGQSFSLNRDIIKSWEGITLSISMKF